MPVIKALDLAYGGLRSPDLDRQEEFLTDFGMVDHGAADPPRLRRPRLALNEVSSLECAIRCETKARFIFLSSQEGADR